MKTQKIVTFLWFDTQAAAAAKFYVSLFPGSKIEHVTRYGAGMPGRAGQVMTVTFTLAGQRFVALNGGPEFQFTPAISLYVNVKTQREVDRLWRKLTSGGGEPSRCGWLKDKFGLSWQIVPDALTKLLQTKDAVKSTRVFRAMLGMTKIDIAQLQSAARG
jgi:predicted 3-demethylubiquinone-9 3-methyltransferase (glyoxalase superfamily)